MDKAMLKATAELLWAKGIYAPKEAQIALAFTAYVEKILSEKPVVEAGKDEATGK